MKIHGIILVRNEVDILRYAMKQNREWCDFVYVFDNGSTDGTWELCQELARDDNRIVPFLQSDRPFRDSLRGEVFRAFQNRASAGDWWCRLDADEIYIDNPRHFLSAIPSRYHVVWSLHYQYYLTEPEALHFQTTDFDSKVPEINDANRPRHFLINGSEARFFRHRSRLQWTGDNAWPTHMGLVAPQRIRLRHFQYRSPAQIDIRLATRRHAASQGWKHFGHSLEESWKDKLVSPQSLNEESDLASLDQFRIEDNVPNHLEGFWHRQVKAICHSTGIWP